MPEEHFFLPRSLKKLPAPGGRIRLPALTHFYVPYKGRKVLLLSCAKAAAETEHTGA